MYLLSASASPHPKICPSEKMKHVRSWADGSTDKVYAMHTKAPEFRSSSPKEQLGIVVCVSINPVLRSRRAETELSG